MGAASLSAFRPLLKRHHDDAIGLVVAEPPRKNAFACYLKCEPLVLLDEHWPCGGFEWIEIAPMLLRNGTA